MGKQKEYKVGENYFFYSDGCAYHIRTAQTKKSGEVITITEPFANHAPVVKKRVIIDDGYEDREEIVITPLRNGKSEKSVSLSLKDILGQTPNSKMGAACRILPGNNNKAYYRDFIQIQCEDIEPEQIYQHTGWAIIDEQRVFLNGENSVTANGLTHDYNVVPVSQRLAAYRFVSEKNNDRYDTFFRLLKVAPKPLIFACLGYTFLTPLNAILREMSIEPRFILYLIGKTGTRKTTMAFLFLSFFGVFNGTPPLNFGDTANSIEKSMALTDSTLLLLDDRYPSPNSYQAQKMESVEQSAIRQIGDRSSRGRMNADGSLKKDYVPKCNLLVTSEEHFSNLGESAVARSVSVELNEGDIDLEELSKIQAHTGDLNACMSDYIQFVIEKWDEIRNEIKDKFIEYRSAAQKGYHGRMAESVAYLSIGFEYMCQFLESQGVMNTKQSETARGQSWEVFMKLAAEQDKRIREETPINLFLSALKEDLDSEKVAVASITADGDHPGRSDRIIGYTDGEYYYLFSDKTYSAIREHYNDMGVNFPVSQRTLLKHLAGSEFATVGFQKKIRAVGKNAKYLRISVIALSEEGGE